MSVVVSTDTMKSISKVSFGTSRIQKLRRVALDGNLLKTLGLEEGDAVDVELDINTATILIRKTEFKVSERRQVKRDRSA